jgi:hypothetical protein
LTRVVDAELATHAQVSHQGIAIGERQPQVLSAAARRLNGAPCPGCGEIVGAAGVTLQNSGIQDPDCGDRAAADGSLKTPTNHLDFGQFRHRATAR